MIGIAGIGIALLMPIYSLFLCFIIFIKNPGEWRRVFPLYVYSIFIIGYCIEANGNNDMNSYFMHISKMEGLTLSESIALQKDALYVKDFFFWLSAQLRMPHIMTGIPVALVVGVASYIACDYTEEIHNNQYLWIVLLIILLRAPLFAIANNIRNVSAFAIAVLAVYRDVNQKKRNLLTIILYIMPIFIHTTGMIVVIARLFIPLFRRYRLAAVLIVFALPAIIRIAYSNVNLLTFSGPIGYIIRRLIYSANNYLAGQSAYAQRISVNTNAIIKRYIAFSWLIFIAIVIVKEISNEGKHNNFRVYTYLLAILALSCTAFNTPAYWRFSTALLVASSPTYYNIVSGKTILLKQKYMCSFVFGIYTIIDIALNVDSFIDNAVIPVFFEGLFLNNAYTLLHQMVLKLM